MTQGYTDVSLSIMAEYNTKYARMLADSRYSPQTFNKLAQAVQSENSFLMIMEHSQYTNRNEPYTEAFLDSLDTVYPTTAANCFATVNYSDMSYDKAVFYVQSGAFYATDQASLPVTNEVAVELYQLHIPLRGCEGFNHCYDVDDLHTLLKDGDAIFVQDMDVAVVVHDLMKKPEWAAFRDSVQKQFGDMTVHLPAAIIKELWKKHEIKKLHTELQDKIMKEHSDFLNDMREQSPDNIICSAYVIVTTDQISMYMKLHEPPLSAKEYKALLSSENALMEIYDEWESHNEWSDIQDIGYAMKKAAEGIQYPIDRENETVLQKPPVLKEPEQAVKPKPTNKPRR